MITEYICRICEGIERLRSLFDESNEKLLLMLRSIADITIDVNDGLPKYICINCNGCLERSFNFKLQCESTDRKLRLRQASTITAFDSCSSSEESQNIAIKTENCKIYDIIVVGEQPNAEHTEENLVQGYSNVAELIIEEKSEHTDVEDALQFVEEEVILPNQPVECSGYNDGDKDVNVEEYLVDEEDANHECEDSDNYLIEYESSVKIKESHKNESNDNDNFKGELTMEPKRPQKRSNDKTFSCNSCSAKFTSFSDLNAHKKTHGDKRFQCPTCSKWFSKLYRMKGHMQIHENQLEFPCTMCSKKYTNRGNLERHIRHFHNQERRYKCQVCGLGFTRSTILLQHLAVHSDERNFNCNLCNKKFKTLYYLEVHKKSHIPLEFRPKKRKRPAKAIQVCICPYCGKKSNNTTGHQNHLRTHTGEKPYECSTCNKRFAFQQTLKTHMLMHTGERPFSCDICGVSFRQIGHLKGHKLIHSGVKQHKCPFCEKAFALRGNLTVHQRLHTGEKPYECVICTKRFYDSNGLKRHKFSHARNGKLPSTEEEEDEMGIENERIESVANIEQLDVYLGDLGNEYTEIIEAEIPIEST